MIDNTGPSQSTQARIEALNGQARALIEKDPRTSLELCKQAQALAASISDRAGFARSLWITGKCLHHMTAYDLALERLARSSMILEDLRDQTNLALCLNDLARTYVALRHPARAIETLLRAVAVNVNLGRRADEAANLKSVSELYASQGDHAASLEYQLEYLAIERDLGRIGAQAESLQHVGASYLELGRNGEAIEYLEKALEAQRSISDQQGQVVTLLHLARGLLETGDHKRALDAARDGLMLSREINYRLAEVSAHKLAGEVFARTGNPSKALRVFELAFNTAREIGDKPGEGEALIGLGRTQLALADAPPAPGTTSSEQRRQNLLREANQTLTKALEVATSIESRSLEYNARESLAVVLEEQGQAAGALEQIKTLRQLERTTRDQNLENRLLGLNERSARPRANLEVAPAIQSVAPNSAPTSAPVVPPASLAPPQQPPQQAAQQAPQQTAPPAQRPEPRPEPRLEQRPEPRLEQRPEPRPEPQAPTAPRVPQLPDLNQNISAHGTPSVPQIPNQNIPNQNIPSQNIPNVPPQNNPMANTPIARNQAEPSFSPDDLEPDDTRPRLRPFERDRNLEANPFPGPKNPYLEGNIVSMVPVVRQTQTIAAPAVLFEPFDQKFFGEAAVDQYADPSWNQFLDLILSAVAAVLCLGIGLTSNLLPTPGLLVLMVIVTLIGPGYGLVAGLFPRRSDLNLMYRAILSVGMGGLLISAFNAFTGVLPWTPASSLTADSGLPLSPSLLAGIGFMLLGLAGSGFAGWRRWRNPGT
jgi:tetratricopeptide (TPR) repeat protein